MEAAGIEKKIKNKGDGKTGGETGKKYAPYWFEGGISFH